MAPVKASMQYKGIGSLCDERQRLGGKWVPLSISAKPKQMPRVFMGVCVMAIHRLSLNLEPVVTCCWSMNGYVWHMALAGDSWQGEWEEGEHLPESYGACLSSPDSVLLGAHWTVASLKVSCWDSWDNTTCVHIDKHRLQMRASVLSSFWAQIYVQMRTQLKHGVWKDCWDGLEVLYDLCADSHILSI